MNRLLKLLGIGLVTLSIGFVSPTLAAQWIYIGESQNSHSYFLDFDGIKGTGSSRTFWAREIDSFGKTVSLSKWIVDCNQRQIGTLEAIEYNYDGSVKLHRSFETSIGEMWEFAPGTIGESYYDFICSRIAYQAQSEITSTDSVYPKVACGDPAPSTSGEHELYPVFVDYSPGTLRYIKNKLCQDAFPKKREDGRASIQVASFTSRNRAVDFASFVREQVGSGEVGEPTIVNR